MEQEALLMARLIQIVVALQEMSKSLARIEAMLDELVRCANADRLSE